jgi:hypothetical protein
MDFGIAETGIARGSPPGTTTEVLRFGIPFAEIRVVSMPPQKIVTLYIYSVGRPCPAMNPFTTRNSQGLLNSTWTRDPPVRPVKDTV